MCGWLHQAWKETRFIAFLAAHQCALGLQGRRPQLHAFGGRAASSLPDEVEHSSNVALFQISGALPISLDLVFTGSLTPTKVPCSA